MADFRYGQFCPVARAVELLGERWTLLVVRELFVGSQRFGDLRRRLPGLSTSVLAERLRRLEEHGIVVRREPAPPLASGVYALGPAGRALEPLLVELARWGARFLFPPRPDDQVEPAWVPLAMRMFARRGASPARRLEVRIQGEPEDVVARVEGGRRGTRVLDGPGRAEASLRAAPMTVLGMMAGLVEPVRARRRGLVEIHGDVRAAARLPELFDVPSPPSPGAGPDADSSNQGEKR